MRKWGGRALAAAARYFGISCISQLEIHNLSCQCRTLAISQATTFIVNLPIPFSFIYSADIANPYVHRLALC